MKGYTGVDLLFLGTVLFQGANTQSECTNHWCVIDNWKGSGQDYLFIKP